jgi:hypothetical protein
MWASGGPGMTVQTTILSKHQCKQEERDQRHVSGSGGNGNGTSKP